MPSLVAKPQQPIQGLTERMYKTIDKKTGCCIIHPKVRLCVYDEEKQRWVIKRKTCFQCGSRSGVGGKHHRHGCSVRDPTRPNVCGLNSKSQVSRVIVLIDDSGPDDFFLELCIFL